MIGHIKTFLAKDSKTPFEYDKLNIDELVQHVDPQLWDAVCALTKSKAENRNTSKATDPLSVEHHIQKVCRFFLLCMMMFCIDDRCSMPMHTLATDMADSQGRSALLVKFLNRLGVCASADTLLRFIQFKASSYQYSYERSTQTKTVFW